jgi:DNA-directed RNA polymerase specialized sigma subunit
MKLFKRKTKTDEETRGYDTSGERFKERIENQIDWAKRMNVVRLREEEGKTFQEIADFYGCSRSNIWQMYWAAKEEIK